MNNIENIRSIILSSILKSHVYGVVDLNAVFSSGITQEWFDDPAHRSMFEVSSTLSTTAPTVKTSH